VERADFQRFDLVVAMDRGHFAALSRIAESSAAGKLTLMMSYASRFTDEDVPDPYYGGPQDFERVLDMIEDAARGLLEAVGRPAQE
jgi:protein-tyrosine phosphatase